jgi:hypothetical protein
LSAPPNGQFSVGVNTYLTISVFSSLKQRKESYAIGCFRVVQLRYSLESGKVKNLTEIGTLEGFVNSYVNLTTLAPDIVEAILDDTLPDHLTLFDVAVDPPVLWEEQREILIDRGVRAGNDGASAGGLNVD